MGTLNELAHQASRARLGERVHGRGLKITNGYTQMAGRLYAQTPKAVWAALAISYAAHRTCGADELETGLDQDRLEPQLLEEWTILHQNGIVKQKPPQAAIAKAEGRG